MKVDDDFTGDDLVFAKQDHVLRPYKHGLPIDTMGTHVKIFHPGIFYSKN